ncbi:hypothetical protein COLO4_13610 [Corchorus olitorius]|uniref:Uncharacterized protein n=1 Tax=Corchorus olitorius TaxID=93759 RepID=A0A1R3JVU6_9ROSI|nr:hypothetical protein COLO4_13610 [Corchorus olitorius]
MATIQAETDELMTRLWATTPQSPPLTFLIS